MTQDRVVILDFETTGLSTNGGDRVIEVGAVIVESDRITDSFQSLVNPGVPVSHFIESYTGISNSMLSKAPGADDVFPDLYRFIDGAVIIAHNASFDRKFLDMELANVGYSNVQPFLCSMRIARRLYPKAPNHKLGTLVKYARVPVTGEFHRALADAEMTAGLWIRMMELLTQEYGLLHLELQLLQKLQSLPIARTRHWLSNYASAHHCQVTVKLSSWRAPKTPPGAFNNRRQQYVGQIFLQWAPGLSPGPRQPRLYNESRT